MLSMYPKNSSRFSRKLDSLFWWFVRLFPLVVYLIFIVSFLSSKPLMQFFVEVFSSVPSELVNHLFSIVRFDFIFIELFSLSSNNVVFESLVSIFEWTEGVLPFLEFHGLIYYATYLVFIEILHLLLDVIVFIPRLARKWINMACQED